MNSEEKIVGNSDYVELFTIIKLQKHLVTVKNDEFSQLVSLNVVKLFAFSVVPSMIIENLQNMAFHDRSLEESNHSPLPSLINFWWLTSKKMGSFFVSEMRKVSILINDCQHYQPPESIKRWLEWHSQTFYSIFFVAILLLKDFCCVKLPEWKRISHKQSAKWQHLSQLKAKALFILQKNVSCMKRNILYSGLVALSSGWWALLSRHYEFEMLLFIDASLPNICNGPGRNEALSHAK